MNFQEVEKLAEAVSKSRLFGDVTKEQVLVLMALAQAEGKHPMMASLEYNVIKSRPALKADAMLSRHQQSGGIVEWLEYTDKKVSANFSHPKFCPKPVLIEWTKEQAEKIEFETWENGKKIIKKLTQKDNWINYPKAMLRARVISEGCRTTNPSICIGVYTPEEVQDFTETKDDRPAIKMPEQITSTNNAIETTIAQAPNTIEPGVDIINEGEVDNIKKLASKGGYTSQDVNKYIKTLGYEEGKVKDLNIWDYETVKEWLQIPKADRSEKS
jgi:DNA-binding MarR family transcriptional regulator